MTTRRQLYSVSAVAITATVLLAGASVGVISASGQIQDGNQGATGNVGVPGESASLDFRGCGQVWVIFSDPEDPDVPIDATIEIANPGQGSTDTITETITESDLQTVPGQYGDHPIYKFSGSGGKLVAASVGDSPFVDNPNRCADNA